MVITPSTTIKFVNIPIEIDQKNQLTFASTTAQLAYFNSISNTITISNCTYQRKDGYVRVPRSFDTLQTYNYCFYQNTAHSAKWFFAFVEGLEYLNDEMTKVYIKTDVWQTYQFDITFKKCFVEREHVNDDTVGLHTLPEGLETGEYIMNASDYYSGLDDYYYVMQVTEWPTSHTSGNYPLAFNFGGVPMAGGAYVFDNITDFAQYIQNFANEGRSEAVYNCYMIPKKMMTHTGNDPTYAGQNSPNTDTKTITKPSTLNGYTPKNRKVKNISIYVYGDFK